MIQKNADHIKLTQQYYRLTEDTYFELSQTQTGQPMSFMNLGLWPASSLSLAQEQLVRRVLSKLKLSGADTLIEGGSGWGGAIPLVYILFPEIKYMGINMSSTQIKFAQNNFALHEPQFIHTNIEDPLPSLSTQSGFFSVECLIHTPLKHKVFSNLRAANVTEISLAEIVTSDSEFSKNHPLFKPCLEFLSSTDTYVSALVDNGYEVLEVEDVSSQVFPGWAAWLRNLPNVNKVGRQMSLAADAVEEASIQGKVQYKLFHARQKVSS